MKDGTQTVEESIRFWW